MISNPFIRRAVSTRPARVLLGVLVLAVLTEGTVPSLWSQTGKDLLPTAPFTATMPALSAWKITTTPRTPKDLNGNSTVIPVTTGPKREKLVSKFGEYRQEITTSPNGQRTETLAIKSILFSQKPGFAAGDVFVEQSSGGAQTDFPELSWISAHNFVSVRQEKDRRYFVYVRDPGAAQQSIPGGAIAMQPVEAGKAQIEAWVDVETLRPYKVRYYGQENVYEYLSAPIKKPDCSVEIRKRVTAYFGTGYL